MSVNLKSPSLTSRRRSTAESEFSIHIRPESHRQPMGSKSGASGGKRQRRAYAPVTRPVGHPGPAEAQPRPSSSQASEWGRKDDAARSASCCARCPIVTSSGIRRRRRFESERGGRRSCPSWSRRLLPDRPEGPSPGPEVTLVLPPHGIIAPAPELADIPIGVLSRLHWWRDADRRNFNSAHRRFVFERRVSGPPRRARSSSSMGAASFLIVLRHIPLHRINDAQERQPHRPEMVLPVHELAKRHAPVHNSIVIAAKRMLVRREALSRPRPTIPTLLSQPTPSLLAEQQDLSRVPILTHPTTTPPAAA